MAAAVHAEAEKADSAAADPQDDLPALSVPAGRGGHPADKPHLAGLGELLRRGPRESVLHVHPRLGREEGAPAPDAQREAPRLRLATVASRLVVRHAGALRWLPGALQRRDSGLSTMSLITLGAKVTRNAECWKSACSV